MKLFVLAASIGYVLGAAAGEDCGALNAGAANCDAGLYCNVDAAATGDGSENASTTGQCADRILNGQPCTSDGAPCVESDYCATDTDTCTATVNDGEDCTEDAGCTDGTCAGACGTCGAAPTNADGVLGGSCCGAAPTDADANYCLANVVTAKGTAGADCVVSTAGGDCQSGICTVTDADTDAEAGTCTIAAGETGGACRDVIEQADEVTGCGTGLTCDSTNAWCQTEGTTEPAQIDSAAPAGTLGGACTADEVTAQTACIESTDVCNETVCGPATEAPTVNNNTTDSSNSTSTDDSPAAIFYGMSMVTGAIAYLL